MTKSSGDGEKKTAELPAVTPEETSQAADMGAQTADDDADGSRVTRELEAFTPDETGERVESRNIGGAVDDSDDSAYDEPESGPAAEMSGRFAARPQTTDENDPDATVERERVTPTLTPPERRHHTLASITRPRGGTNPHGAPPPPPPEPKSAPEPPVAYQDEILDETDYADQGEEEWAIADQPTVALAPGSVLSARPQYLEPDEHSAWPPRPDASFPGSLPEAAASLRRRAIPRPDRTGLNRLASPNGQPMPDTPPTGIPRTAFPDPRMERFRELHRRRDAIEHGERDPYSEKHMTERVRQWWGDLRPGLRDALKYQHEARASGVHPVPPGDDPSSPSRLGDVFGRLAASARGLTGRAQSAAVPTFKRLHNQAELAAQAIVGRFESDTARQQAPFLGPGRIAVFFRSGVTVGQAQRLLSSNDARPLRIIPRKHGFLAYVFPGTEEQVSSRLRVHPYVRDVVYIPSNAYDDRAEGEH